MEKTDNAPRKNTFPSLHSWPSAGVRCFFSSPFHIRPLWECVWKEEEKNTPTPALCQEWEEGNVFFLGALSFFSTWGYVILQETGSNIWLGGLFSALFLTEKFVELELKFTPPIPPAELELGHSKNKFQRIGIGVWNCELTLILFQKLCLIPVRS